MKKYRYLVTFCLLFPLLDFVNLESLQNKLLSRRKRYLTFPEGASVSAAACMTAQLWVNPRGIFTESIAWGLAYDLPNDTKSLSSFLGPKFLAKRRHRRDLYGKMETLMESMGYNGRTCILRTVCEASQRFLPKEDNLLDHILKLIFNYPSERILASEPDEHRIYHFAGQMGREQRDCTEIFNCPFSLIDVALGRYSDYLQ
ncbi:uncharacterized protein LOC114339932 [Diabrotica virgifera virgifera]|uniref:Uncharacterized protein LOC114339932 n=1 Tax=Diabrotica virgifera virgifera TaxID=50390 RepID=A0A6P7GKC8_DIAVI|nr:uncharacterized protein LOC114339932 [Diabrotica virgifera virgifera]